VRFHASAVRCHCSPRSPPAHLSFVFQESPTFHGLTALGSAQVRQALRASCSVMVATRACVLCRAPSSSAPWLSLNAHRPASVAEATRQNN
jgi:hypothetical protein